MDAVPALGAAHRRDARRAGLRRGRDRARCVAKARSERARGWKTMTRRPRIPARSSPPSPPRCAPTRSRAPVLERAEDLMIDWLGSALAGKGGAAGRDDRALRREDGAGRRAERGARSIAAAPARCFAAMANAAASHVAEQDDLHNGSVLHPATVVFPPALAVAQALGASGAELLAAVGRRLRGRHPRRRVPRPIALHDLPHDRHRRHARCRRGDGRTCSASTASRWRTPSARPARRPRGCGNSCARPPTRSSCTPRTPRRRG